MINLKLPDLETMRRAHLGRDPRFDGVFFVGVLTTGIFCRPTCPARTPHEKNVEYFSNARDCVVAGYRPCKRCHPLDPVGRLPNQARLALAAIEAEPSRRWKDQDWRNLGLCPEAIRRQFQRHFSMTAHAYARSRRLGLAWKELRKGQNVLETAMDYGFESSSGFREAFDRVFGAKPRDGEGLIVLFIKWIETPLGSMIAVADDCALYLLEFSDRRMLETQLKTIQKRLGCSIVPGSNEVLQQLERELTQYFDGQLKEFQTPLRFPGTDFQVSVWNCLLEIPYGETRSYLDLALQLKREKGTRAVGQANGCNRIAILIPCHRVIQSNGALGGYGGGLHRKQFLLDLETGQRPLL